MLTHEALDGKNTTNYFVVQEFWDDMIFDNNKKLLLMSDENNLLGILFVLNPLIQTLACLIVKVIQTYIRLWSIKNIHLQNWSIVVHIFPPILDYQNNMVSIFMDCSNEIQLLFLVLEGVNWIKCKWKCKPSYANEKHKKLLAWKITVFTRLRATGSY